MWSGVATGDVRPPKHTLRVAYATPDGRESDHDVDYGRGGRHLSITPRLGASPYWTATSSATTSVMGPLSSIAGVTQSLMYSSMPSADSILRLRV